ncbi:MAG: DNA repair protein RecO [Planctomycetota bacterium]
MTHDRALLLQRTPYGESSLVAVVLAPSHGRVRVLAKGAYRPTSRYFGVLDAFHTLELDWRPAKDDGLALLVGGDWLVRRPGVPRSGAAYRAAWSVLETARLVARDGTPERTLFAECERALDALDEAAQRADERAARLTRVAFDLRALHNLGLAPALAHCAACGRPAPVPADPATARGAALFAPTLGGRLCRACAAAEEARRVEGVPERVLLGARALLTGSAADTDWTREQVHLLERCIDRFTDHHLDGVRRTLARPARGSTTEQPA